MATSLRGPTTQERGAVAPLRGLGAAEMKSALGTPVNRQPPLRRSAAAVALSVGASKVVVGLPQAVVP
jgi:hypothetical protein